MKRGAGDHSLLPMTPSDGDRQPISASSLVWNILPVLGLALVLGAPMLPAFAVAAAVAAVIYAVLAPEALGVIAGASRTSGQRRARR